MKVDIQITFSIFEEEESEDLMDQLLNQAINEVCIMLIDGQSEGHLTEMVGGEEYDGYWTTRKSYK